jgi:DHA2 family multidrug resistance protein
MSVGLALQVWSGWAMMGFNVNVSTADVLWASAMQGLGVGLMWIPLSIATFATLPKALVPDGTGIFHLLRNMGSSIFISVSVALVIRETKIAHAALAENLSPFNEVLRLPGAVEFWSLSDMSSLAAVGREVGRQATMIGYIDAFLLFTLTAALAAPFVLLVRRSPVEAG